MVGVRLELIRIHRRRRRHFPSGKRLPAFSHPVGVGFLRRLVHLFVGGGAGQFGVDALGDAGQFRNRIESLRRSPRLDPGAAPVGADQADRNVEFLEELATEEESGGGERRDIVRSHRLPGDLEIGPGQSRPAIRAHLGNADERKVRLRRNLVAVIVTEPGISAPERELHIRLPAAKPNFAHQNIGDRKFILFAGDLERAVLAALLHWGEFHHPLAVFPGFCTYALPGKTDRDLLAGSGFPPYRNLHAALKHRVVGKNRRKFHFRFRRKCESRTCENWKQPFEFIHLSHLTPGLRV